MKNGLILAVMLCIIFAIMLSALNMAGAESITYVDKLGRTVNIALPIKRAVLFETYELSAGLGIWDRIVGISRI
jgi:iron complex transport system substrate-binding protein